MPARSHESISPSNGAILRGWVPFRDVPAGGTAGKPADRYFFTVRQSQPTSAAISAYDAPASCKARNLRMFIQFSGCRIIEEITLRCSRLGSRRNEGWSTSQGRQGHITRTPAPGHSARNPHAQPASHCPRTAGQDQQDKARTPPIPAVTSGRTPSGSTGRTRTSGSAGAMRGWACSPDGGADEGSGRGTVGVVSGGDPERCAGIAGDAPGAVGGLGRTAGGEGRG